MTLRINPQVLSEIDIVYDGILSGFSKEEQDLTKFQANCDVELLVEVVIESIEDDDKWVSLK